MDRQPARSPRQKKQSANRRGKYAEMLAAFYLRLKGYRILERGFRTKAGEIDIIAKRGNLIAIVEVKYRAHLDDALNAVGALSQQRISNATDIFLTTRNDYAQLSVRFDIIAVLPWRWPKHFVNAF